MPFSQVTYVYVNKRNYDRNRFRLCFISICLTWALCFAIAGFVFLGLNISQNKYLDTLDCSICSSLGTPTSCGYQLCCGPFEGANTFLDCLGDYSLFTYQYLYIACFSYMGYEIFLMMCLLMRNRRRYGNNADVIVINNNMSNTQPLNTNGAYQQTYQNNM